MGIRQRPVQRWLKDRAYRLEVRTRLLQPAHRQERPSHHAMTDDDRRILLPFGQCEQLPAVGQCGRMFAAHQIERREAVEDGREVRRLANLPTQLVRARVRVEHFVGRVPRVAISALPRLTSSTSSPCCRSRLSGSDCNSARPRRARTTASCEAKSCAARLRPDRSIGRAREIAGRFEEGRQLRRDLAMPRHHSSRSSVSATVELSVTFRVARSCPYSAF